MLARSIGELLLLTALRAQGGTLLWDVPELIEWVEVPETIKSNGVPVHLQAARSKWKPEDLWDFYLKEFAKAELYVPPESERVQLTVLPQLTGYDSSSRTSYTVILQPNADKTTTVIMGTANLGRREKSTGTDFAPLLPDAQHILRSDLEGSRSLTFDTKASESDVNKFYREELGRAGYVEKEEGLFQRTVEVIRVWTTKKEQGGGSRVGLRWRTEALSPPGPSP